MTKRRQRPTPRPVEVRSFPDLSRQLRRLALHLESLLRATAPPFDEDSPAQRESASTELAGEWAERPGFEAAMLPTMLLATARDHLDGMAALINTRNVLMAPIALVRPVLSACAFTHHLLEPDIDLRERVRRWANIRMLSVVETGNIFDPNDAARATYEEELDEYVRSAERHGYTITPGRSRTSDDRMTDRWLGKRMNEMTATEELFEDDDRSTSDRTGRGMYRVISAFVHAQVHGTLQLLDTANARLDSPDVSLAQARISLDRVALFAMSASIAVHRAGHRLALHRGVGVARWEADAMPIVIAIRDAATPGSPSPISPALAAHVLGQATNNARPRS